MTFFSLPFFTFNGAHYVLVQALTVIIQSSFPFTIWQGVSQGGIIKEGTHLNISQLNVKTLPILVLENRIVVNKKPVS